MTLWSCNDEKAWLLFLCPPASSLRPAATTVCITKAGTMFGKSSLTCSTNLVAASISDAFGVSNMIVAACAPPAPEHTRKRLFVAQMIR